MSVAQGSVIVNTQYFDSLVVRANLASSCDALRKISDQANESLSGTLGALSAQSTGIQAKILKLLDYINKLEAQIAALPDAATGIAAMGTAGSAASGVSDLGSAIGWIHAAGAAMVSFSSGNATYIARTADELAAELAYVAFDYAGILAASTNLQQQLLIIPTHLAALNTAIANKAATFTDCTI